MTTAVAIRGCATCASVIEAGDMRCAVCGTSVPAKAVVETKPASILRCRSCHAAIRYDIRQAAPACALCGDVLAVEDRENPPESVGRHLPFSVSPDEARGAVREWLGTRGFFCPPDVRTEASVDTVKPLWWVGWSFDVDTLISWTADSNAGSGRSSWAPHSGQVRTEFRSIVLSASKGLTEEECRAMVPAYRMSNEVVGAPRVEGIPVEEFDVDRAGARDRVSAAIDNLAYANVEGSGAIPGRKFRNIHVEPMVRGLATKRFAFPAYVLAYRYRGTLYRTVINGQDWRCVHGQSPLSWLRIAAVAGGALAVIAAIVAIVAAS